MSGWKVELLIIGFILLIGTASALMPTKITITSSADSDSHNGWLVANGVDQTAITIKVENNSLILPPPNMDPVDLANVILSVDPLYGFLTDTNLVTNGAGEATTVFRTNKTSIDNLVLNVIASNTEGTTNSTKIIKIDHDQAYLVYFNYNDEVVVEKTTPFIVTLKDRWGNPVDNKNPNIIHAVRFHIYAPPGGLGTGGLKNATSGYLQAISDNTDATGTISLTARVDTIAGENNIWMEPIDAISDQYPFIVGITQGVPFRMTQEFSPTSVPNPFVPADATSFFSIRYVLYDKFGNYAGNQTVSISTSVGENLGDIQTNSNGEVWISYGPKSTATVANITAIAAANTSVYAYQNVEFRSTAPTTMVLSANPEVMPDRGVNPTQTSEIDAKITDISGNPVAGQSVSFVISGITYGGNYTITSSPSLQSASAFTDTNGEAIVSFIPGGFTTSMADPNFSGSAWGSCVATSSWNGTSKSTIVKWLNYPYLSVYTSVTPAKVNVNETFEVNITLHGDGYKMVQNPIDAVLLTDVSGSMGSGSTPGTSMYNAKIGAKTFNANMNPSTDRIGLVTFGWNRGPDSGEDQIDLGMTFNRATVNNTINTWTGSGNTPTRAGIHNATWLLKNQPRGGNVTGLVKAIVLLTDGQWNVKGDPESIRCKDTLPSGTNYCPRSTYPSDSITNTTSVVLWANTSGIKIYDIGIGVTAQSKTDLQSYATKTAGKYYDAPNSSVLSAIYTDIAGELRTNAGVNTTAELAFDNVLVNNVSAPGYLEFNYTHSNPGSTDIWWQNGTFSTIDQTSQWNANHHLSFNIGLVKINQTWTAHFWLKAINGTGGNIDIFGPGSIINFNNGSATLPLPHTYVSIFANLTNLGINATTLDVSNLHTTVNGTIKDFIPLEWNINYNGNQTVTERISYSNNGGLNWVLFDTNYITKGVFTDYSSLDIRLLPPGEYWIRVDASAPDAPNDREEIAAPVTVGTAGRSYIKLE